MSFILKDICTDLADLGVAVVKELNELDSVSKMSKLGTRDSRLTSSSSEGMIVICVM